MYFIIYLLATFALFLSTACRSHAISSSFPYTDIEIEELKEAHNCRRELFKIIRSASWRENSTIHSLFHNIRQSQSGLENYLRNHNLNIVEGHSGTFIDETLIYIAMAQLPCVKTICEIGFNAGHSALVWLHANPAARVIMFDLYDHDYSPIGEEFVRSLPAIDANDRFTVIVGDSTKTVRQFHREYPSLQCDLLSVDGGHSFEVATADLHNMFFLANPSFNVLLVDDTNCDRFYCVDAAMRHVMTTGTLKLYEGIAKSDQGLSVGTYVRENIFSSFPVLQY